VRATAHHQLPCRFVPIISGRDEEGRVHHRVARSDLIDGKPDWQLRLIDGFN
jgi:hypothetical protein